jgi:tetratricopeptide (TPR) repeat protein
MHDDNPLRSASELARQGRTLEAIACLEAALARTRSSKERPASASTLARTAGLLCDGAGQLSQAALYYEEAIAIPDADPLLLLALTDVRWRLGQADAARSCLARAESIVQSAPDGDVSVDVSTMIANMRARWASGG